MMLPEDRSDGHDRTTEKGRLASIEINGGLAADAFCMRRRAGHKPPFTCGVARTFKGRLHPVTGRPIVKDER
jgi:hypothetical protein